MSEEQRWADDGCKRVLGLDSKTRVAGLQIMRTIVTKPMLLEQVLFADHVRGFLDYSRLAIEVEGRGGVKRAALIFDHQGAGESPADPCPHCGQGLMQCFAVHPPLVVEDGDGVMLHVFVKSPHPVRVTAAASGRPEHDPERAAEMAERMDALAAFSAAHPAMEWLFEISRSTPDIPPGAECTLTVTPVADARTTLCPQTLRMSEEMCADFFVVDIRAGVELLLAVDKDSGVVLEYANGESAKLVAGVDFAMTVRNLTDKPAQFECSVWGERRDG